MDRIALDLRSQALIINVGNFGPNRICDMGRDKKRNRLHFVLIGGPVNLFFCAKFTSKGRLFCHNQQPYKYFLLQLNKARAVYFHFSFRGAHLNPSGAPLNILKSYIALLLLKPNNSR